jgi:hypothetical protein
VWRLSQRVQAQLGEKSVRGGVWQLKRNRRSVDSAAGDSGGDAGPGPVLISSSESCSGSGSYTSNLPNHSATRPFVARLRRAASSSPCPSRLSLLFLAFFSFPRSSDLAGLRESALYVPRSLLDEAPLQDLCPGGCCVRPSASTSSPSASESSSASTSTSGKASLALALRPPKSSSAASARLEIALSLTAAPAPSSSSSCS